MKKLILVLGSILLVSSLVYALSPVWVRESFQAIPNIETCGDCTPEQYFIRTFCDSVNKDRIILVGHFVEDPISGGKFFTVVGGPGVVPKGCADTSSVGVGKINN